MNGKSALVIGASGLVGQELVGILAKSQEYSRITLLVRRKLDYSDEKVHQVIVDFDDLERYAQFFQVDSVFCTLGTTIKIAKTKENFRKVDLDYPVMAARLAKEMGKGNFYVISALGADENSSIFYNQVKGTLEHRLRQMGLQRLHLYRPSMLSGNRKEVRIGERVVLALCRILPFVFIGGAKKYKPIRTIDVAKAMYLTSLEEALGVRVYESDQIMILVEGR